MLNASGAPGPSWAVSIRWDAPDSPRLLLYLDPGTVVIEVPPFVGGEVLLSRFLQEVSHAAGRLVTQLEARRVSGVSPEEPLTSDHDS